MIKNALEHYGSVAKSFHWIIAFLIVGLLCLGLYMTSLPISPNKFKFYRWHKEFGILVLMLAFCRLSWRWTNLVPILPPHLTRWEKAGAHGVHALLYVFMFGMPLSGWAMSSAAGIPVSFFGWFVLPNWAHPNDNLRMALGQVHRWSAYGFMAAILAHTGAALQHHFIYKDNILRRMLPWCN